ncbi:MAG TPA: zinc ribbon domain-containing protein [Desulfuromonadales bacterium]|nr:zinc ribbon domain-containing protein [Desulfuromonadales bacterium]
MPVYEYRCDACNIQFELRQKFSDPPADKCPKCGGALRKLVSAASFSLKGGGWYGDGYGDKAEPAKSEGDTTAEVGTVTEVASTDAAPTSATETTASPATQIPTPTQVEKKSAAAETPTTTGNKAEVKSQGD